VHGIGTSKSLFVVEGSEGKERETMKGNKCVGALPNYDAVTELSG